LILALLTYFAPLSWLLVMGLLGLRWAIEGRPPIWATLALAIITAGWLVIGSQLTHEALVRFEFDLAARWAQINQVGDSAEWRWLFLPLAGLGLITLYRTVSSKGLILLALFMLLVVFSPDGSMVLLIMIVTILLLAALGLEFLLQTLLTRSNLEPDRYAMLATLAVILTLPLLLLHGVALGRKFGNRPVDYWQMERQAGRWLNEYSEKTATVFASAHVNYFAGRVSLPLSPVGDGIKFSANSSDYLVTTRNLAADQLTRTEWFQERYEAIETFTSAYDSASPLTVWGYRPTIFNLGESRPANVKTDHDLELVGYSYDPNRIEPGHAPQVTLYFRATGPSVKSFEPILRLVGPDGAVELEMVAPAIPDVMSWLPGQIVSQSLTLHTSNEISQGAYDLRLSLRGPGEMNVWALYKNNDLNPLDSIPLGYVSISEPVSLAEIIPVGARFGEQIDLSGYTLNDDFSPGGEAIELTLYWAPTGVPPEKYVVFVHLLDQAGQFVTGHDSQPAEGRFPTTAWLPGDLITDQHLMVLDSGLPGGTYQLYAGLYLPDSGERLPIIDGQGNEAPDRALPLTTIVIP
jgi:hypothetical protein